MLVMVLCHCNPHAAREIENIYAVPYFVRNSFLKTCTKVQCMEVQQHTYVIRWIPFPVLNVYKNPYS
jgi:hypothetical protein